VLGATERDLKIKSKSWLSPATIPIEQLPAAFQNLLLMALQNTQTQQEKPKHV
jgi:hypothetical protein